MSRNAPLVVVIARRQDLTRFCVFAATIGSLLTVMFAQRVRAQTAGPKFDDPKQVAELIRAGYPADLQLLGIGGTVRVRLRVGMPGTVDSVFVISNSGIQTLGEAARLAARQFRFKPLDRSFSVELPLTFRPDSVSGLVFEQLPALQNRTAVQAAGSEHLPSNVRNGDIGVSVRVLLVIDSAGSVERLGVVVSSCFREFDDAARSAAASMRFNADAGAGASRRTIGTFHFRGGAAYVRLPGEVAPSLAASSGTDTAEDYEPGPTQPPRLTNVDEVRAAIRSTYSSEMRDRNARGTVGMWMLVDERGSVVRRQVKATSGECMLDVAALDVARVMRFAPAMRNNKPVKVWVDMPIQFGTR